MTPQLLKASIVSFEDELTYINQCQICLVFTAYSGFERLQWHFEFKFSIITVHGLRGSITYEKVGGGSSDTALYICFEAKMRCGVGYFTLRHRITMGG